VSWSLTALLERERESDIDQEDAASIADTEATTVLGSESSEDGHESESLPVAPESSNRPDSTNITDAIARTTLDDVSLPLRKRQKVDQQRQS
jgi:hypothetical protein